ncbi:hypothetical protein [Paenarthrobacter aromaticivorans]|uniref:hypothetical protein n=1 Tax=Paenarthrobacter aromaticivorans TaxID=2849150 RepID=UPI003A808334
MKLKGLALLTLSLTALTSCSSPTAPPEANPLPSSAVATTGTVETPSRTPTPTPTHAPTPTPTFSHVAAVGDAATNGGIQIRLTSAAASPTVSMNTSHYRAGTGMEIYENVPAQAGGKYVIVKGVVTNNAKAPIDLTCGYPIDFKVFNSTSQVYSPIQELYKIQGNPECNAQLQPGFESPMTWAFLVPTASTIDGAIFQEVDLAARVYRVPTYISFGAGLI